MTLCALLVIELKCVIILVHLTQIFYKMIASYILFLFYKTLEYTFSLCVQTHERNLNRTREENRIVAFKLCITKLDWGEELPSRMLQI